MSITIIIMKIMLITMTMSLIKTLLMKIMPTM